jgi:NAD(P)H-dependent flavin oxidoreductase YrpB (nitropropane dioxygenase family)
VVAHPEGHVGVAFGGAVGAPSATGLRWLGTLPGMWPEWLGDRSFAEAHGTRFPYVAGAMANGIGSPEIVIAMAKAGCIGFYGAAGLGLHRVEAGLDTIQRAVGELPYGVNLIHSPQEPDLEAGNVELLLRRGVRRVSASAAFAAHASIAAGTCAPMSAIAAARACCRAALPRPAPSSTAPAPSASPRADAAARRAARTIVPPVNA